FRKHFRPVLFLASIIQPHSREPVVGLLGSDGKARWSIPVHDATSIQVVPDNHILISELDHDRVTKRDLDGNVLWEQKSRFGGARPYTHRLPNGDTFIFTGMDWVFLPVPEIDERDRRITSQGTSTPDLMNVYIAPNGAVMGIVLGDPNIPSIDPSSAEILRLIPTTKLPAQLPCRINPLSNGNVLITHPEYDCIY